MRTTASWVHATADAALAAHPDAEWAPSKVRGWYLRDRYPEIATDPDGWYEDPDEWTGYSGEASCKRYPVE